MYMNNGLGQFEGIYEKRKTLANNLIQEYSELINITNKMLLKTYCIFIHFQ